MFASGETGGGRCVRRGMVAAMRILVFGGTIFVSHAIAAEAVRRGHEVACAARGTSGSVPEGTTLVRVDRDDPDGLEQLRGERFDAVVDTSIMSHRWVADALDALADTTAHWTFVSTASVYADQSKLGLRVGDELHEPRPVHATLADRDAGGPELYGAIKVAAENAVRERFGERAFIQRPGLISGPGDHTDRFGYWPNRFARGGRVLVPDVPDQPSQVIDVRDLARWTVDAAETRLGGTFNVNGPSVPLPQLLAEVASAVGTDHELVPVAPEVLAEHEVRPWAGPGSLPLWLPEGYHGMGAMDVSDAVDAGLRVRSFAEAAEGALVHERALGVHRERRAGISPEEEARALEALEVS